MTDNFLWKVMDSYIGQREFIYRKEWTMWQCWLTNIADIFEQFCGRGCGKILNETNCYERHVKNSAVRVGQKHFMVNGLKPMTAKLCVL